MLLCISPCIVYFTCDPANGVSLYVSNIYSNNMCFLTKVMFQISRICFKSNSYVSNIHIMFPISDVCFQYTFFVSKCKWCFQTTTFPRYVSNIHGVCFQCTWSHFTLTLTTPWPWLHPNPNLVLTLIQIWNWTLIWM